MLPLALTSNDVSVRRLGRAWRNLHRLVYPAAILGAAHFIMVKKVWEAEPLIYLAVILVLLGLRLAPRRKSRVA
jgi:sulfoxide reductase heme-binding subunit YedZ